MEAFRNLMSQVSLAVIVSAITSAVISFASFLIGSRFAKERSDRGTLRQLYQDLRLEMVELREAIERGRPKRWEDHPTSHSRYMPPLITMEHSGRLALIPGALATRLLAVEKEALSAEWAYREWLSKTAIPAVTTLFNERVRGPTSSVSGKSYSSHTVSSIGLHGFPDIEKTISRIEVENLGFGLETALDKNRTHQLYAYPDTVVDGTQGELIRAVAAMLSDDEVGRALRQPLLAIEQKLTAEIATLTRRIGEPQPFWESVRRAFLEVGAR